MSAETLDNFSTASSQYTGPGAGLLTGTQTTVPNNNTLIATVQTSVDPTEPVCDTEIAATPSQVKPQVTESADHSVLTAPVELQVNPWV